MKRVRQSASMPLPAAVAARAEEIIRQVDSFSAENLDEEYAALCRKLVGKLGRKRPSPLLRGDLRIWAAAVIHTIGKANFLFDATQTPHLSADSLSELMGVPKSTLRAKAKVIGDLVGIGPMEPEFCRRALLADNPLAWLIEVDGFIVDARTMPPEIQEERGAGGLSPTCPEEETPCEESVRTWPRSTRCESPATATRPSSSTPTRGSGRRT